MRIALVSSQADPDSAANIIFQMAEKWQQEGHEVAIFTTAPEKERKHSLIKHIILLEPFKTANKLFKAIFNPLFPYLFDFNHFAIMKAVKEWRPDVVNLHWVHGYLIPLVTVRTLAKKYPLFWSFNDVLPIVWGPIDDWEHQKIKNDYRGNPLNLSTWNAKIKRALFRKLPFTIITASRWIEELARSSPFYKSAEVVRIPYGIDTTLFKPLVGSEREKARAEIGIPHGNLAVLFASVFVDMPRKGYRYLLEALQKLKEDHPEITKKLSIVIVGKEKNLLILPDIQCIRREPIRERQLMAKYFAAMDVFAMPALIENLPLVAIESIACGTPVVGFSAGGLIDVVTENNAGILCPTKNSSELANALFTILSNANLRNEMSKNARAAAEEVFSVEKQTKKYLNLFQSI